MPADCQSTHHAMQPVPCFTPCLLCPSTPAGSQPSSHTMFAASQHTHHVCCVPAHTMSTVSQHPPCNAASAFFEWPRPHHMQHHCHTLSPGLDGIKAALLCCVPAHAMSTVSQHSPCNAASAFFYWPCPHHMQHHRNALSLGLNCVEAPKVDGNSLGVCTVICCAVRI
jgi:hypothetical protein